MEDILKDSRFSHIARDPRFKRIPRKDRKVNIDKRFRSMFTDDKFKVKYTMDKRGRPAYNTSREDLKKFYHISSSSSDSEDDSGGEEDGASKENVDDEGECRETGEMASVANRLHECEVESDESSDIPKNEGESAEKKKKKKLKKKLTKKVKKRLRDLTVDYARGEGTLLSDSSSEEETDEDLLDDNEFVHDWGELDHDAERTDDVTNRLAVCNMDWDRIRASDLMVLFNSFLPQGGVVNSVTIYPSEFGLERMKEEEVKGPAELCKKAVKEEPGGDGGGSGDDDDGDEEEEKERDDDNLEHDEENEEGKKYHMEKLRQYQLNRLRYYYAVVVCDSPETANKLYTECDGLEYESSATRLDLRFVPDETTFDQEPREVCDRLPELSKYEPRYFTTTALQQAKVELTWDETDPNRTEMTRKLMSGKLDGIKDADLQAYLASSSGGEEEESQALQEECDKTLSEAGDDPIAKYRALLEDIEQQEQKKRSQDVEMEVTWGVGLKEKTEKLVEQKLKGDPATLTPFQQYLEKRKEKRKQKQGERKKKLQGKEDVDNPFSDDDIPSDVDMNDPYFQEEFAGSGKQKKKEKKEEEDETENEESKRKKAELELLLVDEDDGKKHFNFKAIQEKESENKSKRRKKKRKAEEEGIEKYADDFELNVKDERFSALFTSHLYNIDPADPHYRKTKGMETLKEEKLKRRQEQAKTPSKIQKTDGVHKERATELSMLVKSVKRKSQGFRRNE